MNEETVMGIAILVEKEKEKEAWMKKKGEEEGLFI